MYQLKISREYYSNGTIGTMSYNGVDICRCIEPPKSDNHAGLTCIPEGNFTVLIRSTKEKGLHLWIADVPVRGHVLVNSEDNTSNAINSNIVPVTGFSDRGVGQYSRNAMQLLMDVLKPDLFKSKPVTLFITSKSTGNETKAFSKFTGNICAARSAA